MASDTLIKKKVFCSLSQEWWSNKTQTRGLRCHSGVALGVSDHCKRKKMAFFTRANFSQNSFSLNPCLLLQLLDRISYFLELEYLIA